MEYSIITDIIIGDDSSMQKSFGISVGSKIIHNITTEYCPLRVLVYYLNKYEVDNLHLKDTVDDFLCKISTVITKPI